MSSSTTFKVPEGMSCVNALHALWKNSKPELFFQFHPEHKALEEATVSTAEKVAELFKQETYFDYIGGRMIKTNFSTFPELKGHLYDRDYGLGAAQKAIETYNEVHPSERFDVNDSYNFNELTKK